MLSEHPVKVVKDRRGDHPQHAPGTADALERISVPEAFYHRSGSLETDIAINDLL